MPSTLPSSFASAAAGTNADSPSRTRNDGADWPRRPNGATQTFRRTSTATSQSATSAQPPLQQQRDAIASSSGIVPSVSSGTYVPPHISASRGGLGVDTRYTKNQLLELFREQRNAGDLSEGLAELAVGEWTPNLSNGSSGNRWSKREEHEGYVAPGPDVCWLRNGGIEPTVLSDMTEDEREHFTSSVNSPLKGPTTHPTNAREGQITRKSSVSQTPGSAHGLPSPSVAKSGQRRRDNSESYPFPRDSIASPAGTSKGYREDPSVADPPPSLTRRRTDLKDVNTTAIVEEGDGSAGSPFALPKRTQTFGASVNGPSSPWSTTGPTGGAFGAFALGSLTGSNASPVDARPGFIRGESRFKGLMARDAGEDSGATVKKEPSTTNLGKTEKDQFVDSSSDDRDRLSSKGGPIGSAALGGDSPPPRLRQSGTGTPSQHDGDGFGISHEHGGFGDRTHSYRQHSQDVEEPLSPTFTNPYASPEQQSRHLQRSNHDSQDLGGFHLPGLGGFAGDQESHPHQFGQMPNLSRFPSAYDHQDFSRGQLGIGQSRTFPTLGGLGTIPGLAGSEHWSAGPPIGTPGRERGGFDAFADHGVRSPNHGQTPGFPGLGSATFGPPSGINLGGSGTIGRGSKLGSLFPAGMQDQMRQEDQGRPRTADKHDREEGDIGYSTFGRQNRDTESPFRRGKFEDFFGSGDKGTDTLNEGPGPGSRSPEQSQTPIQSIGGQSGFTQQPSVSHLTGQRNIGSSSSNQPPAAQQKTMVMPDRIRWIYRDPQGNMQGPWSGLEMHDWYRAGFFSPELLVKKVEDPDYEPLAQLIRRIGNSREPFLVPQIGIPGPPNMQAGGAWPSQNPAPVAPVNAPSAQPPFASSFPSFGTTLTAEQQNALERRKQEEQYLMARQKEHLAQQQVLVKQMQMQHGMHGQQLQHHSSAHSLHSQTSFGSMTSPQAYSVLQQTPSMGSLAGGFGGIGNGPGTQDPLGHIQEEEVPGMFDRFNAGRSAQIGQSGVQGGFSDPMSNEQRVATALADRARLEREQAEDVSTQRPGYEDELGRRLQEFHDLSGEDEQQTQRHEQQSFAQLLGRRAEGQLHGLQHQQAPESIASRQSNAETSSNQNLSLAEQVQKAASAKQSPRQDPQSSWNKGDTGVPAPFPPPQSSSPLPAPAARRNRQNVADNLVVGSQSASPSVETPNASIAPWAKEASESQKQPSLREIQEAEARRAAKEEEVAAAARRAALERELANQPAPPAPGLPSSSTWASAESPSTPSTASASVWAKSAAGQTASASTTAGRKTLQQIQKEEEALARRQKAAAAAVSNSSIASAVAGAAQAISAGKRYADLAGKAASPAPTSGPGGAWLTVGAGGKTKVPTPSAPLRSTSSGVPPATVASVTRPKAVTSNSSLSGSIGLASAKASAQEEFKKWAVAELRPDLNKGVQVDDFISNLLILPPDTDIITEAVHSVSQTLDSRHFAEEFVRRRNLADKGKTDLSTFSRGGSGADAKSGSSGAGLLAGSGSSNGGWSEVARKGGEKKDEGQAGGGNGSFKIVAAKKRGGGKR